MDDDWNNFKMVEKVNFGGIIGVVLDELLSFKASFQLLNILLDLFAFVRTRKVK